MNDFLNSPNHKYFEITKIIIGSSFEVINSLGSGFLESVYEKALLIELQERGLFVDPQLPIQVTYKEKSIGLFFADLVVDQKVIIELKAAKTIIPEFEAQILNYLHASKFEVGLLINFGNTKLEYRRYSRFYKKQFD